MASKKGHTSVVRTLIEAGAVVDIKDGVLVMYNYLDLCDSVHNNYYSGADCDTIDQIVIKSPNFAY